MKKYLLILLLAAPGFTLIAANRQIKGTVISADDKQPLISASVYVSPDDLKKAGSSQSSLGVVTDLDGNFTINVPDHIGRIYCSYLGHETKEVRLGNRDTYKIVLESSSTELNDIVVTGYQRVEKRKLTAAVSKIDITEEKIGSIRTIDQALSGQIAGLSAVTSTGAPGAPVKIRIRGTSSLNGTQDPLWVLDGIPLEGTDIPQTEDLKDIDNIYTTSIAGLNPADIADITVLKDAAATAIYGARAANGVIVITTKNGQKGKPKISFSAKLSYSPNIDIDRLNLMNSSEKVQLELDLLRSGYTYRENKGGVASIINRHNLLDAYKAGGWDALSPQAQQEILTLKTRNTDWNDILFRDAFSHEYNLSLSGGNDKALYYTSVGYYDEKGNVPGVEANRFNIVAKTTYQVNKMLKIGASVFANQRKNKSYLSDYDGFTNPVYYSRRANPYQQVYDENGNYIYDGNIQGTGNAALDFNIFEERNNTSNENTTQSVSSIFDVELRLNDKIKVTSQVGLQADNAVTEKIADHDSYAMRKDKQRSYIQSIGGSFLPDGGMHKVSESKSSQVTWKTMGEYRTQINDRHELEAMIGTELRKTWYENLFTAGYGFDRKTLTTKPVIFPKEEDARYFPLHQKSYTENAYVSGFATASYTLLHRYTLGGSIRFDGSDLFGVSKKYRYLPLYSVSGLWRISGEPFMQDIGWIDNLAVRASYGLQGNIDKNTSAYVMGKYENTQILPGSNENNINVSTPPNDKLRWEKTQSVNAGFDFAVLNQAINISADYYYRYSSDLIGMQVLPLESGFGSTTVNWATMRNQGVEVSISTRNINTRNFTWFTTFNLGYNNNKILKLNVPENQTTPSLEGYPVGALFAYKFGGLDEEGYPLFVNKAGEKVTAKEFFDLKFNGPSVGSQLSAEEQRELYTYVGTTEPVFSGGFMNTFNIRRFEISVNCIFNLGHYVQTPPSYSLTQYDRGMNANRDILNRWTPENTATSYPALMKAGYRKEERAGFEDFRYERYFDTQMRRGDYMRVQSIRVGYKLPEKITKLFKMDNGSVSLEGRNLLVVGADYHNFLDPETMGNEFAQPIPKSVVFNVNLNF